MPQIELQGRRIDYRVRRSKRAKRVLVKLRQDMDVEVVYPLRGKYLGPDQVLREMEDWLLRALDKQEKAPKAAVERKYKNGETLPFRGAPHRLRLTNWQDKTKIMVQRVGDTVEMRCHKDSAVEEKRFAVENWYRHQAKAYLPRRTRELAQQHGFRYGQLRIKNQKTRWGSCSAKGNINLNLRLMMAPDEAIDCVIIHELCHLRELNHSPAFWKLLAELNPDYKYWDQWFKDNARTLQF